MRTRQGFTIVELLVVVSIIALLLAMMMPALGRSREMGRRAVCLSNVRQVGTAVLGYADDYDGKPPASSLAQRGQGLPWMWDMPDYTRDLLMERGLTRNEFYCPSCPYQNDDALWNWTWYKVMGYYWQWETTGAQPVQLTRAANGNLRKGYIHHVALPGASSLELTTDATISAGNNFAAVNGGWVKPHRSPHLLYDQPVGGNIVFLDGHGAWRPFAEMQLQSPSPQQWF